MTFTTIDQLKLQNIVQKAVEALRPPEHVRDQVDTFGRVVDGNVEIYQVRQVMERTVEIPAARAKFIKSRQVWEVQWQREPQKWTRYTPCPEVTTLEEFFRVIAEDTRECFFR